MTKFQKYIYGLLLPPFLSITLGLSVLAILTQSLTQLDLLIERGQSPITILQISLLATPQFMAVVAPIAMFATVIMVYQRLYSENEIVVAFSAGQSTWQIIQPAIRLATMVATLILFVNLFIQPQTHQIMRQKLYSIRSDIATTLVREGQFREPVEGLTVFTRKIGRMGAMHGLIVSDSRNKDAAVTYVAKQGAVVKFNNIPSIVMNDGSVQKRQEDGKTEIISFSQYVMELGAFVLDTGEIFFKPGDRYTNDLFTPDLTNNWDRNHIDALLTEANRRFASPLLSITAAFLGVFSIIGSSYSRQGYSVQILKSSAILLVLLLFSSAIISTLEENASLNFIQYLVPIGLIIWLCKRHIFIEKKNKFSEFTEIIPSGAK